MATNLTVADALRSRLGSWYNDITMTKTALSLLLGLALSAALSACNSKTSANEKNFGAAISQHFEKKGEMCLDPIEWPVDVYETDMRQQKLYPDNAAGQMSALEAAGLAKGADAQAGSVKVRRYVMTDAAKPWLRTRPGRKPRLCWGRKSLSKVGRWADPAKVGDHEESSVIYTYQLSDVAPWARLPQVKEAFPELGRNVDGERRQTEKLYVKLTPNGWEALGLND
jgi:hypothetical protein